jgi:hypothetical protein
LRTPIWHVRDFIDVKRHPDGGADRRRIGSICFRDDAARAVVYSQLAGSAQKNPEG